MYLDDLPSCATIAITARKKAPQSTEIQLKLYTSDCAFKAALLLQIPGRSPERRQGFS
jgi:hypothetical protein